MRDGCADLFGCSEQRSTVIALLEYRTDLAENSASGAVANNRLDAITYFGATLAFLDGKQDQHSFVLALLSDAPLAIETIRDILDRLIVDRGHEYDRHLCARGSLQVGAIFFESLPAGRIQHTSKVVHIARGLELRSIEAPYRQRQQR